ncbi:MAG: class I SAM-dependent methyltransferase [Anaerolineales bacterium]|nr:class I SAM-dependent methyltransferase [Anaerolineales bacterium]
MQPEVVEKLLKLNHEFYQTFAGHFSATRQRLQSGVVQVAATIPHTARLLDLGCGNGLLAAHLHKHGHAGRYTGIDTASNLIEIAKEQQIPNTGFFTADLSDSDWHKDLQAGGFDYILCFAVMHHLPGQELRLRFLGQVHHLLAADGRFIFSNWQFLTSERLRNRIVPWEQIALSEDQVDEHDYLMDWRRGGNGLRYVHFYNNQELNALANASAFNICGLFTSDGENGRLGLYHIWSKKPRKQ